MLTGAQIEAIERAGDRLMLLGATPQNETLVALVGWRTLIAPGSCIGALQTHDACFEARVIARGSSFEDRIVAKADHGWVWLKHRESSVANALPDWVGVSAMGSDVDVRDCGALASCTSLPVTNKIRDLTLVEGHLVALDEDGMLQSFDGNLQPVVTQYSVTEPVAAGGLTSDGQRVWLVGENRILPFVPGLGTREALSAQSSTPIPSKVFQTESGWLTSTGEGTGLMTLKQTPRTHSYCAKDEFDFHVVGGDMMVSGIAANADKSWAASGYWVGSFEDYPRDPNSGAEGGTVGCLGPTAKAIWL